MKEICIIKYPGDTAIYGIGTYFEEYVYYFKNTGCKINLIEIENKLTDFYIKEDGNIRQIHIPFVKIPEIEKHNKGICRLLQLYIEDSENLVFHFQYPGNDNFLEIITKYFPLSKLVHTIHYFNWIRQINNDISLFEKIIKKKEDKKIKTSYRQVIDDYNKEKSYLEKQDHIICLSDDTYDLIKNVYQINSKLWLIPNGLREKNKRLSERQKMDLRKKYYIRTEEKILLYVGRIEPAKGIYTLVSCFDEIISNYPDCRLVIIGDGDIDGVIKECGSFLSKVIFTGRIEKKKLFQWYQIADIGLFPSYIEQCSYVGIEMMMHGLPVVASDGFGVKNMFHDRVNAKIAKIGNRKNLNEYRKNLKNSVIELLNSDLSEMQKAARKEYNSKYSIENMQKKYTELINSL